MNQAFVDLCSCLVVGAYGVFMLFQLWRMYYCLEEKKRSPVAVLDGLYVMLTHCGSCADVDVPRVVSETTLRMLLSYMDSRNKIFVMPWLVCCASILSNPAPTLLLILHLFRVPLTSLSQHSFVSVSDSPSFEALFSQINLGTHDTSHTLRKSL